MLTGKTDSQLARNLGDNFELESAIQLALNKNCVLNIQIFYRALLSFVLIQVIFHNIKIKSLYSLNSQSSQSAIRVYFVQQGTDATKTINVAVSSRALFNLEEENDLFVEQGLEDYIKLQVSREDKILKPGAAFPFIKVRNIELQTSFGMSPRKSVSRVFKKISLSINQFHVFFSNWTSLIRT